MSGPFVGDESEDEKWLQEHIKAFQGRDVFPESDPHAWKPPTKARRKKAKKRPIHVGETKQKCPHCGQMAPVEMFRDTKCLACQASEFLGPIH